MNSLVIIPTYNEIENIVEIVPDVFAKNPQTHILVVDDNSPDGTAQKVQSLQLQYSNRLHLLNRSGKQGLGKAYLAGFQWALDHHYDLIIEMDADFSHRPEDLVKLIEAAHHPDVDFVIGSRYVPGGQTVNWGFLRKLISRGGSWYSRIILGYPIRDWTGGFNAWKASVLLTMGLESIQSNGYSFQIELKYKASKNGFKVQEVPIVFADRRVGESKMNLSIVLEAFYRVWQIRS